MLTGFGKFHYCLLFICGIIYVAVAISLTTVSFIVPSAQCDFQMTSFQKGFLNGASMIGTCVIIGYKIVINPRSLLRRNVLWKFHLGLHIGLERQKICFDILYADGWFLQLRIQRIPDLFSFYILQNDEWIRVDNLHTYNGYMR